MLFKNKYDMSMIFPKKLTWNETLLSMVNLNYFIQLIQNLRLGFIPSFCL